MDEFKKEFQQVFKHAPSFSLDAKAVISSNAQRTFKNKWMKIGIPSIVFTLAAIIVLIYQPFSNALLEPHSAALMVEREIIADVLEKEHHQFAISYHLNGMNRGSNEYKGDLLLDANLDALNYGQVVLFEVGRGWSLDETRYELARVIALPGDRVAVKNGQLYVNHRKVTAFYGQAQVLGKQTVSEVKAALKNNELLLLDETIKENLSLTIPEVSLAENEFFAVTDNWSFTGVQQIISKSSIEGIVKGYISNDIYNGGLSNSGRKVTEVEQQQLEALVAQTIEGYKTKNKMYIESIASERAIELLFDKENPNESTVITSTNMLSKHFDEAAAAFESFTVGSVTSSVIYYEPAVLATDNVKLYLRKKAQIDLLNVDETKVVQFIFVLTDGSWKLEHQYLKDYEAIAK